MSDVEVKFGGDTSDLDAASAKAASDIEGVSAAARRSSGGFQALNSTNKQVAQGFKLTGYQAQILSFQMNDVFSGLLNGQKPLQILTQQGPQITQIFGGVRGTFAALTAAITPAIALIGVVTAVIGVAAFSVVRFQLAQEGLAKATEGAGRAAGATAQDMDALAVEISDTANVSTNAARDMQASFAQTGKIGFEMFDDLIAISRDYQYAMGVDAKTATEELGAAMADPIQGAADLNDKMGLLDDTTTQYITTLVQQGRQTEAQKVLTDALATAVEGAADKANGLAKAWHAVATGASDAFDWMGRAISRFATISTITVGSLNRGINPFGDNGTIARADRYAASQQAAARATAQRNREQAEANRLSVQAGEAARSLLPKEASIQRLQNQIVLLRRSAAQGGTDAAVATRAIAAAEREIADLQKPERSGRRGRGGSGDGAARRAARERERAAQEALRIELATLDRQQAAVEDNLAEWTRIQDQKIAKIREFHTEESTEYERAEQQKEEFTRRFNERKAREDERLADRARRLEQQRIEARARANEVIADADAQLAAMQIDSAEQALGRERSFAEISASEELARRNSLIQSRIDLEIDTAERMYNIRRQALMDNLALAGLEADEMARINLELEGLAVTHQQNLRVIRGTGQAQLVASNRQAADELRNTWQQNITGMTSSFTGMFTQWGAGIQDFRTGWQNFGRSILSVIETNVSRMVENWLLGQLGMTAATTAGEAAQTAATAGGAAARTGITAGETAATVAAEGTELATTALTETAKTGATAAGAGARVGIEATAAATTTGITATTALSQIAARAASAAAGAYSAIAAIPVVGPVLAPVAAATALAGVLALGNSIFSAKRGVGSVANDGDMYELHKEEMVLPAAFANPLRAMLTNTSPGRTGMLASSASSAGTEARSEMTSKTLNPTFNYQPSVTAGGGAPPSLESLLQKDGATMRRWINNQVRNGKLKVA
ncbi:prophage tail length tape measure protein [Brevundimonas phage vB_BpoS-Polewnik]|nr:prophage tail length tape measure protein [Brevundimonas phage vB_BpoS-Polewnik]